MGIIDGCSICDCCAEPEEVEGNTFPHEGFNYLLEFNIKRPEPGGLLPHRTELNCKRDVWVGNELLSPLLTYIVVMVSSAMKIPLCGNQKSQYNNVCNVSLK